MSVARDSVYNLAGAVAPAIFMLAVTPFYLGAIGPERFGVLAICWTMVAALQFASLGMGPALTYRLAIRDDRPVAEHSAIVWTALAIALLASLVGAVLVVGAAEIYFKYFFHTEAGLNGEIRQALPLLGGLLPLAVVIGVLNGALQGRRRFGTLNFIAIVRSGLLAVVPLAVAWLIGVGLKGLVLATVAASALVAVWEFAICTTAVPLQMPLLPRAADVRALVGYGAWMSATSLIAPLVLVLDRFVIGAVRGPAAVAIYVLPYYLVQQLVLIPASLTSAVLPRYAPLSTEEDVQRLQSSSLTWLNGLLTPLSIVAIAFAAPFFSLWIGPTLGRVAGPVAAILLVGGWVHGIGHIPSTLLAGRSRPQVVTKLLLICLIPYVGALYWATFHFGVMGAAAVWTLRAAFDPLLFISTRPRPSDLWRVALSAVLVLCAMASALTLAWTSAGYWVVMTLIITAACYQNRTILVSSVGEFRKLAFSAA